jgi:L-alanine-DL-glutamate epimerase-like enolase superfamily enzyme
VNPVELVSGTHLTGDQDPRRPMSIRFGSGAVPSERLAVSAYRISTDAPESDGTIAWDGTTLVLVEATAGSKTGIGYSYADASAARLIRDILAKAVEGADAMAPQASWTAMARQVRNIGRDGIAATAISAVDVAVWDLKARPLDVGLVTLLGRARESGRVCNSSSTPTGRIRANKPWRWPSGSRSWTSPGSRSRSAPTTSKGSA